jgi:hypothetical protein
MAKLRQQCNITELSTASGLSFDKIVLTQEIQPKERKAEHEKLYNPWAPSNNTFTTCLL